MDWANQRKEEEARWRQTSSRKPTEENNHSHTVTTAEEEEQENKKERKERGEQTTQIQNGTPEEKGHGEMPRIGNKQEGKTTERTKRKTHYWEKVGLVEYNLDTNKWECRIDECEAEIDTAEKISPRRKNTTHDTTLDPKHKR